MKKTAFFSDVFFAFFTVATFTLCLFRYFRISLPVAFFLAILCGALCALSIGALLYSKRKNLLLKKSDELQKQKLLLHLALLPDEQKIQLFEHVFLEQSFKRQGKLRFSTLTELYFLRFSFSPVSANEIAAISHFSSRKQKVLLCCEIEEKANALCQSLHIQVKTGTEVYLLVKEANALPEAYLGEKTPIAPNERRKKLWFSKNNAKRFLSGGALILLTSLFTPFAYYYLIFGSLLLATAALVRIFGYE